MILSKIFSLDHFDSKYDFEFFSNIEQIEEGKNKNLIFRSKINNDLYVYNDISKKISCLNCEKNSNESFNINDMFIDKSKNLWLGTSEGLFFYDNNLASITELKLPSKLLNINISVIEEGPDSSFWIGSDSGLYWFKSFGDIIKYNQELDPEGIISNIINDIDWDKKNEELWISTDGGISLFSPDENKFENFQETPFSESIKENFVGEIMVSEGSGNVWFKTKNYSGINCLIRWYNEEFQMYEYQFNYLENDVMDENSLASNDISAFIGDRAGNVWIGTRGGGISLYSDNKSKFTSIVYDPENEWGIKNSNIVSIASLSYGNMLWISNDFGLELISLDGLRNYEYSKEALNVEKISVIKSINDHILWVGTNEGILKINTNNDSVDRYNLFDSTMFENSDILVHDIKLLKNGYLIAGTDYGLYVIDTVDNNFKNYKTNFKVKCILEHSSGNIFLGSELNGLYVLNQENVSKLFLKEIFVADSYTFDQNNPNGISSSKITKIIEDESGSVWIGTDIGLNKFDKNQNNFKHYFVSDGLPSNYITSIESDKNNNLWISTKNGISFYDQSSLTFSNYGFDDGIFNIDFHNSSSARGSDGSFLFGGPEGLTIINLEKMNFNNYQPKCVITKVTKTTFDDDVKTEFLMISDEDSSVSQININSSIKSFTINFVALNFYKSSSNKYRYKLQNLDNDWLYSKGLRFATYNNLGRGSFRFEVQGSNNDNVWSNSSFLDVKFIPHPLLSNFAIFVYVILGLIAIYIFVRSRSVKQKKEMEEKRKTEELKQARDFQMSLIPQAAPNYPGYEFAFFMKTSTEVGGDYYDFFPQDDGSIYVVVGDATGHGLNAGMMVSITKAGLYASDFSKPSITTSRLNQTIKSIDLGTTRMSLNMTRIKDDSLVFTSAGMPPGYLFNHSNLSIEELLVPGLPLGSMKNLKFQSHAFKMNKGDAFVLISDGLPECENPKGAMLDYPKVEECVKKNGDKSAQGIIDSLVDLGENWMDGRMNDDDITLVVIKKT